MELVFDPQFGIRGFIDGSDIDRISDITIAILKHEKSHLFQEEWWQELINRLSKLPQFRKSWLVNQKTNIDIYSQASRHVTVNIKGIRLRMTYAQIHLYSDPRFSIVEYLPENRIFQKLLGSSRLG